MDSSTPAIETVCRVSAAVGLGDFGAGLPKGPAWWRQVGDGLLLGLDASTTCNDTCDRRHLAVVTTVLANHWTLF